MLWKKIYTGILLTVFLWLGGCNIPPTPIDLIKPPRSVESTYNNHFISTITSLIPDGARVLVPDQSKGGTGITFGDIDGDGIDEAVLVYEESVLNEKELKAVLLKQNNEDWQIVWDTKGFGYGIDYMDVTDVNGDGLSEILLGWSLGAGGNGLDIYGWKDHTLNLLDKKGYENELDFIP